MKIQYILFYILLVTSHLAHSENLHNRRGFDYENPKILAVEKNRVSLSHDSGLSWIEYKDLTPESLAWVQNQKIYKDFIEIQNSPETIAKELAKQKAEIAEKAALANEAEQKKILDVYFKNVTGKIIQVFPDGVLVSNCKIWGGTYEKTILRDQIIYLAVYEAENITCRIFCDVKRYRYVDGNTFSDAVTSTDNYSYTNTLGSTSTVRAFTTDFSQVLDEVAKDIPRESMIKAIRERYWLPQLSHTVQIPVAPK